MAPPSFALRPLPCGDRRPKNLAEFIQRVNAERDGFLNITEESLRKELEAEANGVVESKEVDMADADAAQEDDDSDHIGFPELRQVIAQMHAQAEYDSTPLSFSQHLPHVALTRP